jgi:flagellin-like protein
MSLFKNRKAISPVIATVILVAVAITISVAVAYWMGGISGQYTRFEKVEIQAASCVKSPTAYPGFWVITLTLKNSGSATSTLNGVYVDDIVATSTWTTATPPVFVPPTVNTVISADVDLTVTKSIPSGQTGTVTVYVGIGWPSGAALTSGTTIDIKLHSAGGMDYIKLVQLV